MKSGMIPSSNIFIGLTVLTASVFYSPLTAAGSYQAELGISAGYANFDDTERSLSSSGDGKSLMFHGAAYLSEVELTNTLPYKETAFWARHAGVFVSGQKTELSDLRTVRGSRLLMEVEYATATMQMRYAEPGLPIWLELGVRYEDEVELQYIDGTRAVSQSYTRPELTLGWFLTDLINIDIGYEWESGKSYAFGLNWLYPFLDNQMVGLDLDYKIDRGQHAFTAASGSDDYSIALNYYPLPALKANIALSYQQYKHSSSIDRKTTLVGVDYFLSPSVEIRGQITRYHQDALLRDKSTNYTAGISYRF